MPRVVHIVATSGFAGVEHHVVSVSRETAARGWEVAVIGGDPIRMPAALDGAAVWRPGADVLSVLRSCVRLGRCDICHAHMTRAEVAAILARPLHCAPVIATRHFAARRGASSLGRLAAPLIGLGLAREIAVSDFVAGCMERRPDNVIRNGVPSSPSLWRRENRAILVLQRLEREKDTLTALAAWQASCLADEGWTLRIVGDGSERPRLEEWVEKQRAPAVEFVGWSENVQAHLADSGMLIAPAPAEPFGLAVVEAMAAGIPVVASAAGGHTETIGRARNAALFPPGDAVAAAAALRRLAPDNARRAASEEARSVAERELTLRTSVDRLLDEYEGARAGGIRPDRRARSDLTELVVCSLEPWDDVWRRNQFLVDRLLRRNPQLRVLFVEPPSDVLFDLWNRRRPSRPRLRAVGYEGRLRAFRPLKPLPRRLGRFTDGALLAQVRGAVRIAGFSQPVLWINDVTYAPLIERTGWPSLYDITDDWLLAPFHKRERKRLSALDLLALDHADEVVVCSQALATSRGATRQVTLIPNAVDVEHFRQPRSRPEDLPPSPVAVYAGSLHEARLDVSLVLELANSIPNLTVALVGPDALARSSRKRLEASANVRLLGPRPYADIPAYFQHADVVVVPHVVSDFTDSLDPIKLYESAAARAPTVATPVAGFRGSHSFLHVADRLTFVQQVRDVLELEGKTQERSPGWLLDVPTWRERSEAIERVTLLCLAKS